MRILPHNYRPISLLEVPCKLLERIINKRLREHLKIGGHYNKAQYGFRRRRGTIATETIAASQAPEVPEQPCGPGRQ